MFIYKCSTTVHNNIVLIMYCIYIFLCYCSLEMLDKTDVPLIVEGYPLVVAMNALLNAVKSVSLVINDRILSRAATPPPTPNGELGTCTV